MGYDTEAANEVAAGIADRLGLRQQQRLDAVEGLWRAVSEAAIGAGLTVNDANRTIGASDRMGEQAGFAMKPDGNVTITAPKGRMKEIVLGFDPVRGVFEQVMGGFEGPSRRFDGVVTVLNAIGQALAGGS